jgi:hypothetical protein
VILDEMLLSTNVADPFVRGWLRALLCFVFWSLVTHGAGHLNVSAADPITVRDLTR